MPDPHPPAAASEPRLYDVSPTVGEGFPVWPGDTPYAGRLAWAMAEGATVNVSVLTTTPHLGSHVDAPLHTEPDGTDAARLGLTPYLGRCRVVEIPGAAALVEPSHLAGLDLADPPRLLLKTGTARGFATGERFPERFTALSPAAAARLAAAGALLVGLDTPSVDPFDSKTLDAHHALARGGVAILEGLDLAAVPPGLYELIALPLKVRGLDASPVRAVLRELPAG